MIGKPFSKERIPGPRVSSQMRRPDVPAGESHSFAHPLSWHPAWQTIEGTDFEAALLKVSSLYALEVMKSSEMQTLFAEDNRARSDDSLGKIPVDGSSNCIELMENVEGLIPAQDDSPDILQQVVPQVSFAQVSSDDVSPTSNLQEDDGKCVDTHEKTPTTQSRRTSSSSTGLAKMSAQLKKQSLRSDIVLGRQSMSLYDVSFKCVATSPFFDATTACIIFIHSAIVGMEIQWSTQHTSSNEMLYQLGRVCNLYFLLELMLRMAGMRLEFFLDPDSRAWNIFDMALVIVTVAEEVFELTRMDSDRNKTMGAAKMLKMMRVFRVLRVFRFLRPLSRLAVMIMDSIKSLIWAMFMMGLMTYVFAISITSQTAEWLASRFDISQPGWSSAMDPATDRIHYAIWSNFGNLQRTIFTLFKTILGGVSWENVSDPLLDVGWLPVFLLLVYISFTVLAVLNVITGVFVDNAFKSASKQRPDSIQREIDAREEYYLMISDFFEAIDEDLSGEITPVELGVFLDDPTMAAYFRILGIDIDDPDRFVRLLDLDHSGAVNFQEFAEGCLRFKGTATSVDMHTVLRHCEVMQARLDTMGRKLAGEQVSETDEACAVDWKFLKVDKFARNTPSSPRTSTKGRRCNRLIRLSEQSLGRA
eukprot:TRINITY_DN87252_c0_g1_i1.p1 TRINITY_DN87252_c0_g1~~TRINITY_DN87252_c0_g1_i1.p1  ORF type:complete len:645 (-),score=84.05 TRINITY_DN87252_c0_g1_i1:151-2085(-)